MKRVVHLALLLPIVVLGSGCSLAPKSFRDMVHTAPIVRARAVGLGERQSEEVSVPAMIDRLDDSDCVVRMAANDGLKSRTGKDFGFVPWGGPEERSDAAGRWRSWWAGQGHSVSPSPQISAKVAGRAARGRRSRRRQAEVQGGATPAWPAIPTSITNP